MRRRALIALLATAVACPTLLQAQEQDVIVYLVRHAERAEDGTNDPPISREGQDRSTLLASMLVDAGLTDIHTTDYRRTRQTGAPTEAVTGLTARTYNPRDLQGFAAQLRSSPGRHLVLGHSNTTPELVSALGGTPHGAIEEMEYDRLYMVVISGESVNTILLRFGEPY